MLKTQDFEKWLPVAIFLNEKQATSDVSRYSSPPKHELLTDFWPSLQSIGSWGDFTLVAAHAGTNTNLQAAILGLRWPDEQLMSPRPALVSNRAFSITQAPASLSQLIFTRPRGTQSSWKNLQKNLWDPHGSGWKPHKTSTPDLSSLFKTGFPKGCYPDPQPDQRRKRTDFQSTWLVACRRLALPQHPNLMRSQELIKKFWGHTRKTFFQHVALCLELAKGKVRETQPSAWTLFPGQKGFFSTAHHILWSQVSVVASQTLVSGWVGHVLVECLGKAFASLGYEGNIRSSSS